VIKLDFGKVIERFKELKQRRDDSMELSEIPTDVHLTSLRRQRNEQLQKEEKKRLKTQIKNYVKKEEKELWGFKNNKPKKMYGNFDKKKCVLHDPNPVLKIKNPLNRKRGKFI